MVGVGEGDSGGVECDDIGMVVVFFVVFWVNGKVDVDVVG